MAAPSVAELRAGVKESVRDYLEAIGLDPRRFTVWVECSGEAVSISHGMPEAGPAPAGAGPGGADVAVVSARVVGPADGVREFSRLDVMALTALLGGGWLSAARIAQTIGQEADRALYGALSELAERGALEGNMKLGWRITPAGRGAVLRHQALAEAGGRAG